MITTITPIRPVVNITHKAPGAKPVKFARMVFPEDAPIARIKAALDRFPESLGFRCDVRQVGPQGFSLPLDLGGAS